jgi:hypothetical protein
MKTNAWLAALLVCLTLGACSRTLEQPLPAVTVHKSPTCGCCEVWVKHIKDAGFPVTVQDTDDMAAVKERAGVPARAASCHTAEVGGYFVEGHVPAAVLKRLLQERPAAKGIAVPGMPMGSPGMEVPSGQVQPYDVLLVASDGSTSVFSSHGQQGQ